MTKTMTAEEVEKFCLEILYALGYAGEATPENEEKLETLKEQAKRLPKVKAERDDLKRTNKFLREELEPVVERLIKAFADFKGKPHD